MTTGTKNLKRFFSQYKILALLFAIAVIWIFFGQITAERFGHVLRECRAECTQQQGEDDQQAQHSESHTVLLLSDLDCLEAGIVVRC